MAYRLGRSRSIILCHSFFLLAAACLTFAQGTREDYQRAQRFLPGNLRQLSYVAVVTPNWIEKTNRFWYLRTGAQRSEFILVDPDKNTSAPAFDQTKLADALSSATKRQFHALELPFSTFEFVNGSRAIHFLIDGESWTCDLEDYSCSR